MSFSLSQHPPKFAPAYNEMIYVVSSSASANLNFRYILWLYAADGTTLLIKLKVVPRPDGYGVFDIHRIIENYLTYDCTLTASVGTVRNLSSHYEYIVHLGEEWSASGTVTEYDRNTQPKQYAYNACFDFPDFAGYNQVDWLLVAGAQKKFLTNQPRTLRIQFSENAFLHLMTDTSVATVVHHIKVIAYNSVGSTTTNTFNSSNYSAGDAFNFLRIPAGPLQLGVSWVPLDTVYYTVQMFDSGGLPISELFTYIIDPDCNTKYTNYRLHFLNKMGGFDSFTFVMKSRKTININRETYRQVVGSESAGAWSYNTSDRVNTQFDIQVAPPKISIESDFISDAEAVWLEELVTSPVVFLDSGTALTAVNIESTDYETKQKQNDKLINIKLDISYSYDKTRQRQ